MQFFSLASLRILMQAYWRSSFASFASSITSVLFGICHATDFPQMPEDPLPFIHIEETVTRNPRMKQNKQDKIYEKSQESSVMWLDTFPKSQKAYRNDI